MCLGCLACSAASCACGAAGSAAKCCGRAIPSVGGRVGYVAIFLAFSLLAWIFRGYASQLLSWIPSTALEKFCTASDTSVIDNCFSVLTVFRVSAALAIFHASLGLLMIGVTRMSDARAGIQEGGWLWKVLIIVAMIIGSLWVPPSVFEVYGWIALVGAGFFILVQLMLLVDFAHSWAESWIEKYEEDQMEVDGSQKWWWLLLTASLVCYLAFVAGTVVMYVWFVPESSCQLSSAVVTMNIVFAVLIGGISCHPKVQEANPRSGLLQSAVVTAYGTYLIYSALMSNPDQQCNPFYKNLLAHDAKGNITIALGAVFTVLAVVYSAIRSASQLDSQGTDEETRPLTAAVLDDEESTKVTEVEDDRAIPYHFSRFHVIFVFGACYIGMLMSDWSTVDANANGKNAAAAVDMGQGAMWVKIISSWLCLLFYLWTLVAPFIFPNREWN